MVGTAAGCVTANGTTYRGDYKNPTEEQLKGMSIGPGNTLMLRFWRFVCLAATALCVVMKALIP